MRAFARQPHHGRQEGRRLARLAVSLSVAHVFTRIVNRFWEQYRERMIPYAIDIVPVDVRTTNTGVNCIGSSL